MRRQKRRAQIVKSALGSRKVRAILDAGCSEGYATSFISALSDFVVGLELNLDTLRIAKDKIRHASFVNASFEYLPFRDKIFDAVCVLEVLEHMNEALQRGCLIELDRVLESNGVAIISVPYKEKIIQTRCTHCNKFTPLYGHLHSLDEQKITDLFPPDHFQLKSKYHAPNLGPISCSALFEFLPLPLWLPLNNLLGLIRKGYWIVLLYSKRV